MTDEDILKLQMKGPEMLTALLEGSDISHEAEKIGRDIDFEAPVLSKRGCSGCIPHFRPSKDSTDQGVQKRSLYH